MPRALGDTPYYNEQRAKHDAKQDQNSLERRAKRLHKSHDTSLIDYRDIILLSINPCLPKFAELKLAL